MREAQSNPLLEKRCVQMMLKPLGNELTKFNDESMHAEVSDLFDRAIRTS